MASSRMRWSDLGSIQKASIILGVVVQFALLITALLDLRRRPATQIRGSKRMWTAAVFVNYIGPIAYLVWGRKRAA